MIRRPPRSTLSSSSAASDVYKRQLFFSCRHNGTHCIIATLAGLSVVQFSHFTFGESARRDKLATLELLLTYVVISYYNHRPMRSNSRSVISVSNSTVVCCFVPYSVNMASYDRDKTSKEYAAEATEADCGAWITYTVNVGEDEQQLPLDAWLQHNSPSTRTRQDTRGDV